MTIKITNSNTNIYQKQKYKRIKKLNDIKIVPFAKATHYLIDVIPLLHNVVDFTEIIYDCLGTSVPALLISDEYTYVYAQIDNYFMPVRGGLISLAAHAAANDTHFYYNAPTFRDNIVLAAVSYRLNNAIKINTTSDVLGHLDKLSIEKITGQHHIHFTASEVYSVLNNEQKEFVKQTLHVPKTMSTTAVGGMILWLSQCPKSLRKLIQDTKLFSTTSYSDFSDLAKIISIKAKTLQNLQHIDLRPIFELDTLINRITGTVDWSSEMQNRINPKLANIPTDKVYNMARSIFMRSTHHGERARNLKWKDYWANRWQWTASGSFHSQYLEDEEFKYKEQALRNKFIAAIAMPEYDIEYYLQRTPEIHAWSSTKYEWGKQRAIYGCDFTSYALTNFVFYNAEDTLGNDFPVGKKARPSYVASRVSSLVDRGMHYCLDFEDFNSQHSNENMIAVMRAWIDHHRLNLSEEQLIAADWVMQSVNHTIINDNIGLKTSYHSKGTLMSGWRLTTFINSVLNKIYTSVLTEGAHDRVYSLHNGDDVIMTFKNLETIRTIYDNADKFNVRIKQSKCNLGSIAEFLRVDHVRGQHGQYLSRNIATMMHGRIESKKAITARDAIEAFENRASEFIMRDGSRDTASRLREIYYRRMSKIYHTTIEDLYITRHTHAVCGGISQLPNAPVDFIIKKIDAQSDLELPEKLPGILSYAKTLLRVLDLTDVPIELMVKRVKTATLGAIKMVRTHLKVMRNENLMQYKVFRGIYKAYAELNDDASMGKAQMTGFAIEVAGKKEKLSSLTIALHAATDKLRYLSLVL